MARIDYLPFSSHLNCRDGRSLSLIDQADQQIRASKYEGSRYEGSRYVPPFFARVYRGLGGDPLVHQAPL